MQHTISGLTLYATGILWAQMELFLSTWFRRRILNVGRQSGSSRASFESRLGNDSPLAGELPVAGSADPAERNGRVCCISDNNMTTNDVNIDRVIAELQELSNTQSSSRARELRQRIREQIDLLLREETEAQAEAVGPETASR